MFGVDQGWCLHSASDVYQKVGSSLKLCEISTQRLNKVRGHVLGEVCLDLDATLRFRLENLTISGRSVRMSPVTIRSCFTSTREPGRSKLVSLTTLISGFVKTEMFSDNEEEEEEEEWVGTL